MESKETLLKKLGFSNEFLKEIENNSQGGNFENLDTINKCFDSLDSTELDLTSLVIEKTDEPLSLNAVYTSK